jgi:hypothetical protein
MHEADESTHRFACPVTAACASLGAALASLSVAAAEVLAGVGRDINAGKAHIGGAVGENSAGAEGEEGAKAEAEGDDDDEAKEGEDEV